MSLHRLLGHPHEQATRVGKDIGHRPDGRVEAMRRVFDGEGAQRDDAEVYRKSTKNKSAAKLGQRFTELARKMEGP